jgi:hypothetical protein
MRFLTNIAVLIGLSQASEIRCSYSDFQDFARMLTNSTTSLLGIATNLTACIPVPNQGNNGGHHGLHSHSRGRPANSSAIRSCLIEAVSSTNNSCAECMFGSVSERSIACMINCSSGRKTVGCDKCDTHMTSQAVGKCLPEDVAKFVLQQIGRNNTGGDLLEEIASLADSHLGAVGRHYHPGRHEGMHGGMRCGLGDFKRIIPQGRGTVETFVECLGNLSSLADSWTDCLPSTRGLDSSSNCTTCVTDVMGQIKSACSDVCTVPVSRGFSDCRHCLHNAIAMGMGLCLGVSDPPALASCSGSDAYTFNSNNGSVVVLNCIKSGGDVATCLAQSTISNLNQQCLSCLAVSRAWSSNGLEGTCSCSLDPNSTDMTCDSSCDSVDPSSFDSVLVDGCFDPNGLRRPNDTQAIVGDIVSNDTIVTTECAIDDITTLASRAGNVASCLSTSGSTVSSCFQSSSISVTCLNCLTASVNSTCDSLLCWNQELSSIAGSCLYGGTPVVALASDTPAPSFSATPLWAASTIVCLVISSILFLSQ